jgi:hypothetical protein
MKCENYDQAGKIVEKIKERESLLGELDDTRLVIAIRSESFYSKNIMTIGIGPSYEHSNSKDAGEFLDRIRHGIEKEIARLKAELMDL